MSEITVTSTERLAQEIERQRADTSGAEIFSRSQVRLEAAERERDILVEEGQAIRKRLAERKVQLAGLQQLIALDEAALHDVELSINAEHQRIHALREGGVTL